MMEDFDNYEVEEVSFLYIFRVSYIYISHAPRESLYLQILKAIVRNMINLMTKLRRGQISNVSKVPRPVNKLVHQTQSNHEVS